MPENTISQPFSHVTETEQMFIICEFEDEYKMYLIDLNCYVNRKTKDQNIYKLEYKMTINRDEEKGDLQAFHVRGGDM